MESCLYSGVVRHERLTPARHRFEYRLWFACLDLAELPDLARSGLLSDSRFGFASYRRRDHFGEPTEPLDESVRALVHERTGRRPSGSIRLLTQPSCLGLFFSPLNLFFCEGDGAIVAEVRNTPWLERHTYVLWDGNCEAEPNRYRHAKTFHVSPFMGMDVEYRWRVSRPAETLEVDIENVAEQATLFRASLRLQRQPLDRATLRKMLVGSSFGAIRVTAAIYFQAFQLWRKRCPFYSYPTRQKDSLSGAAASPVAARAWSSELAETGSNER